jgi:hypothetical protein
MPCLVPAGFPRCSQAPCSPGSDHATATLFRATPHRTSERFHSATVTTSWWQASTQPPLARGRARPQSASARFIFFSHGSRLAHSHCSPTCPSLVDKQGAWRGAGEEGGDLHSSAVARPHFWSQGGSRWRRLLTGDGSKSPLIVFLVDHSWCRYFKESFHKICQFFFCTLLLLLLSLFASSHGYNR